jgi:hypothetical protein
MLNVIQRRARIFALLGVFAPLAARAQTTLPDGRAILKRFAEVSGGAKLLAAPGLHEKGTFELPAQGFTGSYEAFADKTGRSVAVTNISGIGEIREGSDATTVWTVDPVQGPRILLGKEAAERRELVDFRGMLRDTSLVTDAKTVVRMTMDGEQCFQVRLTWKSGRTTNECYSEATGFLVRMDAVETTSMGDIPVSRSYSEYKTFGGITIATKTIERTQGLEATHHVTAVMFEVIDEATLALPPVIKAMKKS